ncbi:MAG: type pilus assembly ATPase PilB, type pilus assembly protein PilB [Candidatus Parcubacteria bacterium]|jgi:type IV pilus assembly protein PilB
MAGSIEDLLGKKQKSTKPGDETAQEKFADKMEQIRLKNLENLTAAKAREFKVDYINLAGFPISPEALQLMPRQQAKDHKAICFLYTGKEVRIGAVDPKDPAIEEIVYQVNERTHADNAKVYIISEHSFMLAEKIYDALPEVKEIVKGVQITEEDLKRFQAAVPKLGDLDAAVQKVSTTDFVALIIAISLSSGVSDIHIEAQEKYVDVKYRIDGILNKVASVKKELWQRIVNRIKLFSGLKLNIVTVPQDGRFTIFTAEGKVDVRVSTLPTAYGESIVMRLLKPGTIALQFEQLGIRGIAYEQLKREVERPNGMIITTGPTGSGKTTSLYAILNKLNDGHTKIITLEDPVEYKLEGISQSQVDKSKDYTFAKGLHSILRQDPDVVMVGELRELETAEVAIQAALTGHLVLSTIHTNSAAGAVPRFLSMDVKPFLLAPALNAVIGQRLVRRICKDCITEDAPSAADLERAKKILSEVNPKSGYKPDLNNLKFYKGKGCATCGNLGYKGRMGIYEIMVMSEEIEKVILSGQVSEYDMQRIAMEQGMVSMVQDGLLKALDKITTLEEVYSVAE